MNSAIQVYQPAPMSLGDIERVATAMARSGAFGVKDPNTALILCLLAQDEGRTPVAAARDYHVIQGTPAKKADAMLRDFLLSGGSVEWHTLTDDACSATFSHPQGGRATIGWDKARVAQAQLGSNPMHKKYPRQMLRSRVVSEGVRTVFPGATSGMYVPEEVADFTPEPVRAATPLTPQPVRARDLKQAAAPEPEPEAPAPVGATPKRTVSQLRDDMIVAVKAARTTGDLADLERDMAQTLDAMRERGNGAARAAAEVDAAVTQARALLADVDASFQDAGQ